MPGALEVRKLVHYALISSNLEQTRQWYAEVLGARLPALEPGFPPRIQLADTTIDLFPIGGVTPAGLPLGSPVPGSIGQHHAFEIALDDFDGWTRHLESIGQQFRCAAHGTRYMSIYLDDPTGTTSNSRFRLMMRRRGVPKSRSVGSCHGR